MPPIHRRRYLLTEEEPNAGGESRFILECEITYSTNPDRPTINHVWTGTVPECLDKIAQIEEIREIF